MKDDARLRLEILDELRFEPAVDDAALAVSVRDGNVTLSGHVDSYARRNEARHAVERVAGVRALDLEIEVRLPPASERTDGDIARCIAHILQWTAVLPRDQVTASVDAGWVTLSGDVDWDYQRKAALDSVTALVGVQGICDDVTIRHGAAFDASVKHDIEAALKRRAASEARRISVEVHGDELILSGTVHSLSERALARRSAWSAPGVRSVVDNIVVDRTGGTS